MKRAFPRPPPAQDHAIIGGGMGEASRCSLLGHQAAQELDPGLDHRTPPGAHRPAAGYGSGVAGRWSMPPDRRRCRAELAVGRWGFQPKAKSLGKLKWLTSNRSHRRCRSLGGCRMPYWGAEGSGRPCVGLGRGATSALKGEFEGLRRLWVGHRRDVREERCYIRSPCDLWRPPCAW
jgi:hypothetical protein